MVRLSHWLAEASHEVSVNVAGMGMGSCVAAQRRVLMFAFILARLPWTILGRAASLWVKGGEKPGERGKEKGDTWKEREREREGGRRGRPMQMKA